MKIAGRGPQAPVESGRDPVEKTSSKWYQGDAVEMNLGKSALRGFRKLVSTGTWGIERSSHRLRAMELDPEDAPNTMSIPPHPSLGALGLPLGSGFSDSGEPRFCGVVASSEISGERACPLDVRCYKVTICY